MVKTSDFAIKKMDAEEEAKGEKGLQMIMKESCCPLSNVCKPRYHLILSTNERHGGSIFASVPCISLKTRLGIFEILSIAQK